MTCVNLRLEEAVQNRFFWNRIGFIVCPLVWQYQIFHFCNFWFLLGPLKLSVIETPERFCFKMQNPHFDVIGKTSQMAATSFWCIILFCRQQRLFLCFLPIYAGHKKLSCTAVFPLNETPEQNTRLPASWIFFEPLRNTFHIGSGHKGKFLEGLTSVSRPVGRGRRGSISSVMYGCSSFRSCSAGWTVSHHSSGEGSWYLLSLYTRFQKWSHRCVGFRAVYCHSPELQRKKPRVRGASGFIHMNLGWIYTHESGVKL